MIEKPAILITSIGRTGTEFFAKLFAEILPDCTSLHEPDIVKFTGVESRFGQYLQQVRRAGLWRLLVLKALGQWTLATLSDARFLRRLDRGQAASKLCGQRRDFVARQPGSIYVEANFGYYGLLDVTPAVFERHKIIYVIRDGRDWVSSSMNWGEAYGKSGIRKWISHRWPAASDLSDDPYSARWGSLSRFERLCWAWARLNEYALATMSSNPHARLFFFEKIYQGAGKYEYLDELMRFATDLDGPSPVRAGTPAGWLERKIHAASGAFPRWEQWSSQQKFQFETICGPLMKKLGYGNE